MKKNRTYGLMDKIGLLKMITIMRFTIFILFLSLSQTFAVNSYSQQAKLSLDMRNVRLEDVLDKIEKNSEFFFMYNKNLINVDRKVDIQVEEKNVTEVLNMIFANTDISYSIKDRQILLINSSMDGKNEPINQQQKSISGKVTDSSGGALPGVSVVVKGTTTGVISDSKGNYSLSNIPGNAILHFSFIGMKGQDVAVDSRSTINVVLDDETIGIEEVVAIGYGKVKKSDLTGSVSSVSTKDLSDRTVANIGSLIQGKVAGVDVQAGQIRVRGVTSFNNTDPLVIIDGFIGGSMGDINTNDIESIEVLKDASSTAIYGARGANGVILVNTKSGKAGPLKVSFNYHEGIKTAAKKMDMLNASQYVDYAIDALTAAKMQVSDKLRSPDVRIDQTNWSDEILRTGQSRQADLNFSGGSEKSTFFISFNYGHDEEVYIGPSYDVSRITLKNQFNMTKWLKVGDNISLTYNMSQGAGPTSTTNFLPFEVALPYMAIKDPNNYWGYSKVNRTTDLSDAQNPVATSALSHPQRNSLGYKVNLWADIEPLKGLIYHVQAGITGGFSRYKIWNDQYDNNAGGTVPADYTEQSAYNIYPALEEYLTYGRKFKKHDLKVMIGNSWENYGTSGGIGIYGQGFTKNTVQNVMQAKTRSVLNDDYSKSAYLSYFGRLNYEFNDRYLITANVRRDASPRFASKNRWGTFPSIALAWKMNEEPFIKNLNLFDVLKLRANWGKSGNDAIGDFRYLSKVWTNGVYYPLGNSATPFQGATVVADASQNIKWETTISKSLGVDMAFLKNKLSINAEYFVKNTNDILFAVPRASSLGYGLVDAGNAIINAASCENKGIELQVSYKNNIGQLRYTVDANYTHVNNEVTSLGLGQPYLDSANRTEKGYPIGYLYGYVAQGVFMTQAQVDAANLGARNAALAKNPALTEGDLAKIYYQYSTTTAGDVNFKDVNGDGIVTDKDRTMIGNTIPKNTYGLAINLEYKGFDFNVYFQGVTGSDVFWYKYGYFQGMQNTLNVDTWTLNRWKSEADPGNGIVPRAVIGDPNQNNRISSMQIYSGNYLKIKQLSIGYKFPSYQVSKIGLTNLRLFVNGENLLTSSKYAGYDPEFSGTNINRGRDWNNLPTARTVSLGIQIGL